MQLFQFWRQLPQFGDSYHCWIHKLRWLFTEFPHLVESFTLMYPNNNQIPQHTRWRSLETSTVVSQLGRPPQLPSGLISPRNRGSSCMLWGLYHNISFIYCLSFGGRNLSQGPPPPFCPHVGRNVGVGQSGQRGIWQISGKHEAPFWRGVFFHYANMFIPYRNNFFQATGFQKNDSLEDQVDIVDMSWWDVLENYWSAAPVGKVDLFQFLGINCCAWRLLLQVFFPFLQES